jgi:hypothetical protein
MDDKTIPNRAANTSKAEGDRWESDSETVERRDRDMGRGEPAGTQGGGITNRPIGEEQDNQQSLPERGESRDGANAGHGKMQREERQS